MGLGVLQETVDRGLEGDLVHGTELDLGGLLRNGANARQDALGQGNNRSTESTFTQLVHSTIDRYTVTEWSDFFAAVSWEPQLESAASLTERLQARIPCHPVLKGLPAAELALILIYEVLTALSHKEVTARILTHAQTLANFAGLLR